MSFYILEVLKETHKPTEIVDSAIGLHIQGHDDNEDIS